MIITLGQRESTYVINEEVVSSKGETYEIAGQINRGGNATVHECIDSTGNVLAIKFMLRLNDKMLQRFEQEIKALKEINHPHMVKYVDDGSVMLENRHGQKRTVRFLVMEKADKNLFDFMKMNQDFGYETYSSQFRGLCEALSKLHEIAIHRDIKPENILVKGETWLLSDLGLCSFDSEERYIELTEEEEKIGPKYWLSPEAINRFYFQSDEISKYSDVFQLCAVFWFVVTKRHPTGILQREDWKDSSESIYDVIVQALSHDYRRRPKDGKELYDKICEAIF